MRILSILALLWILAAAGPCAAQEERGDAATEKPHMHGQAVVDQDLELLGRMKACRVSFGFAGVPIPQALDFLSRLAQVEIRTDPAAFESAHIDVSDCMMNFQVENLPFDQALMLLLKMWDLGYRIEDRTVIVTTWDRSDAGEQEAAAEKRSRDRERGRRRRACEFQRILDSWPVALDLADVRLYDVASYLGCHYRISIMFAAAARKQEIPDRRRSIRFGGLSLRSALAVIAREWSLEWHDENRMVVFALPADPADPVQAPGPSTHEDLPGEQAYDVAFDAYEKGDYARAAMWFQWAARKKYRPASSLYNAACCLALDGHREYAFSNLYEAVQCGFDDRERIRRDPDLNPLRDMLEYEKLIQTLK